MINWNVVPMWWGDNPPYTLFTEMEWIGKLAYMYNYMDTRVSTLETDVDSIQDTLSNHTTRIVNLETITDALPTTYLTIADAQDTYLSKDDAMDLYVPMDTYTDLWLDYTHFKNSVNTNSETYTKVYSVFDIDVDEYSNRIEFSVPLISGYDFIEMSVYDGNNNITLNTFIGALANDSRTETKLKCIGATSTKCIQYSAIFAVDYTNSTINITINYPSEYDPVNGTLTILSNSYMPILNYFKCTYIKKPTYAPTEDDKTTLYHRANVTGSGEISSSDGAIVNEFYAAHQANPSVYPQTDVGFTAWYTAKYSHAPTYGLLPDVNGDGVADSSDAALILSFYAEVQAGNYTNNINGFWRFING